MYVSPREIYDEIVGLRGDVRSLGEQTASVRDELADHEERLRALEQWRYAVPAATVVAAIAAVAQLIR
ncbi:hypothetical protein OHV05_04380 [Kitasatospora sp. NBC_00070]|uniref:hypothetical protein n=1 Tax=Kitasatospora sp. NBC_00070 TaxID=2975962 RepID=UPI0032544830